MTYFHLAIPVFHLEDSRHFYQDILGCTLGRTAPRWIDINFWGHQVSLHLVDRNDKEIEHTNAVDSDTVPVRHFGLILSWDDWQQLKDNLKQGEYAAEISWVIAPKIRFQGEVGEQATMFIRDPSGNVLEFKAFQNERMIFEAAEKE